VKPHLPIRARLALVSASLAAGVLALGLLTVYLIEARQVHQALAADARQAAQNLALAGERDRRPSRPAKAAHRPRPAKPRTHHTAPQTTAPPGTGSTSAPPAQTGSQWTPPPVTGETETGDGGGSWGGSSSSGGDGSEAGGGVTNDSAPAPGGGVLADFALSAPAGGDGNDNETPDDVLKTYLGARSGSSQLLVYIPNRGRVLANTRRALHLARRGAPAAGSVGSVSVGGERYVVATAARGKGLVLAGLPVAEADAGVRRLLDAMLIVCLLGLVPAAGLAWLVARRALSPLSRIAQSASRVTAGDLSVRMGPVPAHDEIAEVATAINAMLDRLESAFQAQRRFVHDASHELRTPLTIARGHLEVALPRDGAPPELRQAVEIAIGELDRMGLLVDSLLRLARADERSAADRRPVDVAALAERAVDRCRVLGERDWELDLDPGATVHGDEAALEQVLLNLLSNAVRHTREDDSVAVAVGADQGHVTIAVADSGEGIDPDLLPSLFDRFTRADSARSRDTGGAGLGLAICQAIADAHGGTISATSTPGHGATFVVTLPAAVAEPRNGEVRVISPPAHA
jgi:two-component system OmpR family sensor kinase